MTVKSNIMVNTKENKKIGIKQETAVGVAEAKSDKSDTIKKEQARTTIMKAKFLEAMNNDVIAGNIMVATQTVGITRETYYAWKEIDPEFDAAAQEAIVKGRQKRADIAESKLDENVRKGNMTAIMYTLNNFRPEVFKRDVGVVGRDIVHKPSAAFMKMYKKLMAKHGD